MAVWVSGGEAKLGSCSLLRTNFETTGGARIELSMSLVKIVNRSLSALHTRPVASTPCHSSKEDATLVVTHDKSGGMSSSLRKRPVHSKTFLSNSGFFLIPEYALAFKK